jgi:hypothetical protein
MLMWGFSYFNDFLNNNRKFFVYGKEVAGVAGLRWSLPAGGQFYEFRKQCCDFLQWHLKEERV